MNWLTQNWDKVLTVVISVIISGTVGFFSAIFAVKTDLSNLAQRVATNETEIKSSLKPKVPTIERNSQGLRTIQTDVDFLKRQNDIATQTNKLLDLRIEQQREKTLQELRTMLKQVQNP